MDPFTLLLIAFGVYILYQAHPGPQSADLTVTADNGGDGTNSGDFMTAINQQIVTRLAQAIAVAEGFYVPNSRPARDHNPGDMTQDLIGKGVGKDGAFVVFASDDDGWNNLYAQVVMWLSGQSAHANANSTIQQIADFYTTTQQDIWANNVAAHLGVSVDTPISELA